MHGQSSRTLPAGPLSCSVCAALRRTYAGLLGGAATPSFSRTQNLTPPAKPRLPCNLEACPATGARSPSTLLPHEMPKGADLHMHLAGAVYAETFMREAAEDHLCVNRRHWCSTRPQPMTRSLPPQPVCGEKAQPVANAFNRPKALRSADRYVFSMRTFVPTTGDLWPRPLLRNLRSLSGGTEDPKHVGRVGR